jgi:hypothetical protein
LTLRGSRENCFCVGFILSEFLPEGMNVKHVFRACSLVTNRKGMARQSQIKEWLSEKLKEEQKPA